MNQHRMLPDQFGLFLILLLCLGLIPQVVQASISLGLAEAYSLQARGVEAPAWNPATLAWEGGLALRLFSTGVGVSNNSFSLKDYERWNGKTWSESDKQSILGHIPGSGLTGEFSVRADGPAAAWRGWALTTQSFAQGRTRLPREFARLLLFGNDPQESFDLAGSGGEGMAWSEVGLSHGLELPALSWTPWGSGSTRLAVGGTVRYLRGWAFGEVTRASGGLVTTMDGIEGRADLIERTAQGGSGFGLDLGVAARLPERWDFGLSVRNVYSGIRWSGTPEEHHETVSADSITADGLEGEDDPVTHESTKSAIGSFSRSLPAALTLAAAHPVGPVSLEADLAQPLSGTALSGASPRLALGASYPPWSWLDLRAGFSVGRGEQTMCAGGLGFGIWRMRLDLALAALGSVNPFAPKGVAGGISISTR
jgi:hypothetical protein